MSSSCIYVEPLGTTSSEIVLPAAVTVQITCTDDDYSFPIWYLQGQRIDHIPSGRKEELGVTLFHTDTVDSRISSPMHIDGSPAIHNTTLQCRIWGEIVYSTTLLYQESQLPAPSNLTATNDSGSTIMIEWNPPILQDTEQDHVQIRMDPNILVYSVNIIDTTTNRTTLAVNVTQTSYRFTNFTACHGYWLQVSAWNAAGEGDGNTTQYLHKRGTYS